jgi:hypothetical protein
LFYLVEFGIAWVLENDCTICFSGLHTHGGVEPTMTSPPPPEAPPYTRITAIGYCPSHLFSGACSWAFGADPNGRLYKHVREMQIYGYVLFFRYVFYALIPFSVNRNFFIPDRTPILPT